ncbi:MAG: ankyrin repeat domain-containing protein [Myxococcaceae bacterium]
MSGYVVCEPLHGEPDAEKVIYFLKHGASPNQTCLSGMTPLHWSRNAKVTQALIDAGANVSARNMNLQTPLHLVPDAESVRILVAHGANPNSRDSHGNTPLHTAKDNKPEIVQELLSAGADPNAYNADRATPLHIHAANEKIAGLLIQAGANPSLRDRAAHLAFQMNQHSFKSRAEINSMLSDMLTPSFGLGIFFLIVFSIALKLARKSKEKIGTYLIPFALISLLMNPFFFHGALVFSLLAFGFLYWVPGPTTVIFAGTTIFWFLSYHLLMFFLSTRKLETKNKSKMIKSYILKNLTYWSLLPYYILLGIGFTEKPGDATGDSIAFLGIPYLIFLTFISYCFSKSFFSKAVHYHLNQPIS